MSGPSLSQQPSFAALAPDFFDGPPHPEAFPSLEFTRFHGLANRDFSFGAAAQT
jgi:hypothetical protein